MAEQQEPVATPTEPAAESPPSSLTAQLRAQYETELSSDTPIEPSLLEGGEQEPAPQVESPEPASSPPKHSPHIAGLALDLGLTQAEIDIMPEDALAATVRQLAKRPKPTESKSEPKSEPTPEPEEAIDFGVNIEEEFTPEMQKALKAVATHNSKKIKALEAELAKSRQQNQAKDQVDIVAEVDKAILDLGPGFEKVLGKGTAREMKASDTSYKRRLAIFESIRSDPPKANTWGEAYTIRAKEMFSDLAGPSAPAADPLATRKAEYQAGGLAKPTQRAAREEATGRKAAIAAVKDFMKEHGSNTTVDDDDFPDEQ